MEQRTMRENLEITEIHRDHLVQAAMLGVVAPMLQDSEVRSILERHQQSFTQAASQLSRFSHNEPGIEKWRQLTQQQPSGLQTSQQQNWSQHGWSQPQPASLRPGEAIHPEVAICQCLMACKYLSLSCIRAASESADSQLRQTFVELAENHLRMAEELFHILHRRGFYPLPPRQPQDQQVPAYAGSFPAPNGSSYQQNPGSWRNEPNENQRFQGNYANAGSEHAYRNY